jgi:hypothetical protein
MSQTMYSHTFTDNNGQTDKIDVTVGSLQTITSNAQGATVMGEGYAVTSIGSSIAGITISGETGVQGVVSASSNNVAVYDNALFPPLALG